MRVCLCLRMLACMCECTRAYLFRVTMATQRSIYPTLLPLHTLLLSYHCPQPGWVGKARAPRAGAPAATEAMRAKLAGRVAEVIRAELPARPQRVVRAELRVRAAAT